MQSSALSLFQAGELAFKHAQWRGALAAFAGVVRACPAHLKSRFRVADALLNTGRQDLALDVYKAVAWHALNAGFPLTGIVAVKMALLLDSSDEDLLVMLAELYSRNSDRVDMTLEAAKPPELDERPAHMLDEEGDVLIAEAARLAAHTEGALPYPERVPPIPLLSHLDEDAFIGVVENVRLRRFGDEELVIRQGERGESFFIVADGDVFVKRDVDEKSGGVTMAHLHRGAVFGEMALISDEPRQASVVARGDADLLEVRRSDLIVAASHLSSITQALKSFTRERFLRNLTATHAFFATFSRDERHRVMENFRVVTFRKGDVLIPEGEPGPGLFLLLGGAAFVSKTTSDERIHLATLRGADVCGEMSLVGDAPTSATVTAEEDLEALFLARADFKTMLREHPDVMRYLAGLTDERLRQNRALLHSRGLLEDDEHVMI